MPSKQIVRISGKFSAYRKTFSIMFDDKFYNLSHLVSSEIWDIVKEFPFDPIKQWELKCVLQSIGYNYIDGIIADKIKNEFEHNYNSYKNLIKTK